MGNVSNKTTSHITRVLVLTYFSRSQRSKLKKITKTRVNTLSHQKVPPCLPRLAMMTLSIKGLEAMWMCAAVAGYINKFV
jgi:hypothetical protein